MTYSNSGCGYGGGDGCSSATAMSSSALYVAGYAANASPAYTESASSPAYGTSYSGNSAYSTSTGDASGQHLDSKETAPHSSVSSFQQESDHSHSEVFFSSNREQLPNISTTEAVMPFVEQAFMALTHKEFPKSISLHVVDALTLRTLYLHGGGKWSAGIRGFSLNKWNKGISNLFVQEAPLDQLMLTIGHEIGHVLSPTLADPATEEAKAFAFSFAWVQAIRENNIGWIAGNFTENPAINGIHDVGFGKVKSLLNIGLSAVQVFVDIAKGMIGTRIDGGN